MITPQVAQSRASIAIALLISFVLLASTASAQLPGAGQGGAPIAELQVGIRLLREQKSEEARDHFEGMAKRDPEGSHPRYYLALAHAALGAGPECLAALAAAAERGWPRPEDFPADPGLAALREKDETFRGGLDALAAAWRARSEDGVLAGAPLPAAEWVDAQGDAHPLAERGRPTAVLFLRAGESQDLTALWALETEAKARGGDLRAVILVECPEKEPADKRERLVAFRRDSGTTIPSGLATEELRRLLHPFRGWPTLLWIDAEGRATRAVEGFPPDLEARYAAVLRVKSPAADAEEGRGKGGAEPPRSPGGAPPAGKPPAGPG